MRSGLGNLRFLNRFLFFNSDIPNRFDIPYSITGSLIILSASVSLRPKLNYYLKKS